jgi:UrcA family protein
MWIKSLSAAAAALVLAPAAFAASAPTDIDAPSVRVALGDLNLASEAGATAARRRVHAAALAVCGDAPSVAELSRRPASEACVAAAYNGAARTVEARIERAQNGGADGQGAGVALATR